MSQSKKSDNLTKKFFRDVFIQDTREHFTGATRSLIWEADDQGEKLEN